MISRFACNKLLTNSLVSRGTISGNFVRVCSYLPSNLAAEREKYLTLLKEELPKPYDGPERDHVNFPHIKMPEYPGKVRFGFLPDEWFQFFYKKTGVTGPYLFGLGFVTFLLSKEWYVIEEELSTGCALWLLYYVTSKKYGDKIKAYIKKESEIPDNNFEDFKLNNIKHLEESIEDQRKEQFYSGAQQMIYHVKKENVLMQLEAEYRSRMMSVYQQVKKRLDFQLDLYNEKRQLEQKYMVDWIVSNVIKSITPQQEKEALRRCIDDLKLLAARA